MSSSTDWQWTLQVSSSPGASWAAAQQRVQAWQQVVHRECRQVEPASKRARRNTEPWHHRHASSNRKQESATTGGEKERKEGRKEGRRSYLATNISEVSPKSSRAFLKALSDTISGGFNDSINPKLISRVFVCDAERLHERRSARAVIKCDCVYLITRLRSVLEGE